MYDPATTDLIRSVPPLEGLDAESLAEKLTAAFTEIVSFRLTVHSSEALPKGAREDFGELQRLANTYEVYAVTLPTASDRSAAAFVAATAHQLLFKAEDRGWLKGRGRRKLSRNYITSDVSSALLFVLAGYPSDAVEALPRDGHPAGMTASETLVHAISLLISGRLQDVLAVQGPALVEASVSDDACDALWRILLRGVKGLAASVLESRSATVRASDFMAEFRRVQELAINTFQIGAVDTDRLVNRERTGLRTYAGPYHLATLLLAAGDQLAQSAVTNVPAPEGADGDAWRQLLRRIASRRPFLWSNHLEAISANYLDRGVSAAISFPTGAGKSTLAELKIAATLAAGRGAVFLAPTLALVGQTVAALAAAFPSADVSEVVIDDDYEAASIVQAAKICVMTPERCLSLLGFSPDAFGDVGVVVFDECHLLHPTGFRDDHRALDAMLCVLGLAARNPDADLLLLSAMMSNTADIASWLSTITQRAAIPLTMTWKPTRQARGCVVFDQGRISELKALIDLADVKAREVGAKRRHLPPLTARPNVLFGLQQSWSATAREAYRQLPLIDFDVRLAESASELKPNKNEVAARITSQLIHAGVKTLVFIQNKEHCNSVAGLISKYVGGSTVELTDDERAWQAAAIEDLGGVEYLLGPGTACAPHHSLLLQAERRLNESLFARSNGIPALVATPTLAQGLNLPAEAVVIVGERRFDPSLKRNVPMLAHELLNAAGRAGRAGHFASGVVLVIPGEIVTYDGSTDAVGSRWWQLREQVFSKSDQCLEIEDPIGALLGVLDREIDDPASHLLDRVQTSADAEARLIQYFLTRLPGARPEQDGSRELLRRTLGAFRARAQDRTNEFEAMVERALAFRETAILRGDEESWVRDVASSTGMSLQIIRAIGEALDRAPLPNGGREPKGVVRWLFDWVRTDPSNLDRLIGSARVGAGLSGPERKEMAKSGLSRDVLDRLEFRMISWMEGSTLAKLETAFGVSPAKNKYCKHAREFVRDFSRDLAYSVAVVLQVAQAKSDPGSAPVRTLGLIPTCVREGFDAVEHLAIWYHWGRRVSRVAVHRQYQHVRLELEQLPWDSFRELRENVARIL